SGRPTAAPAPNLSAKAQSAYRHACGGGPTPTSRTAGRTASGPTGPRSGALLCCKYGLAEPRATTRANGHNADARANRRQAGAPADQPRWQQAAGRGASEGAPSVRLPELGVVSALLTDPITPAGKTITPTRSVSEGALARSEGALAPGEGALADA